MQCGLVVQTLIPLPALLSFLTIPAPISISSLAAYHRRKHIIVIMSLVTDTTYLLIMLHNYNISRT